MRRIRAGISRAPAFAITVGLCLVSARGLAGPPTSLVYSRTPDALACPDELALRRAVATRLGTDPFTTSADARRSVEVSIARANGGYRATVRTSSKAGPTTADRTFDAGDRCEELVETVALAISVALDPTIALDEPMAPPEPAPAEPVPARAEPVVPDPERASPVDGAVGLGGMVALGEGPAPAFSGAIYGAVRQGWLGAVVEVRRSFAASGESGGVTVASTTTAFLGGPCAHLGFAFGCGVIEVAFATARFEGDPREDSTVFPRLGARLGVAVPFLDDRFELRASLDALGLPGSLQVRRGDATVYEYPAARVGIGVGLGVRF